MFIAYTKDNIKYVENADHGGKPLTWNDIPTDASITALALTQPVPLMINNQRISPKVSIKRYNYYYFFNEAIVSLSQNNQQMNLVAKVIAGVDVEKEYVLEVRLDKCGNTSISSYPLHALLAKFSKGQMSRSILKLGISCTDQKKLI